MVYKVDNLEALQEVAQGIVENYGDKSIFAFYGPMGAGKTTLIKMICNTIKVKETVNSPTFAIINEYTTLENKPIYHFDFYRINKIEEAFDIGYEEYFYSGHYCFIEWPEKIESLLPSQFVKIRIRFIDETREISIDNMHL